MEDLVKYLLDDTEPEIDEYHAIKYIMENSYLYDETMKLLRNVRLYGPSATINMYENPCGSYQEATDALDSFIESENPFLTYILSCTGASFYLLTENIYVPYLNRLGSGQLPKWIPLKIRKEIIRNVASFIYNPEHINFYAKNFDEELENLFEEIAIDLIRVDSDGFVNNTLDELGFFEHNGSYYYWLIYSQEYGNQRNFEWSSLIEKIKFDRESNSFDEYHDLSMYSEEIHRLIGCEEGSPFISSIWNTKASESEVLL